MDSRDELEAALRVQMAETWAKVVAASFFVGFMVGGVVGITMF